MQYAHHDVCFSFFSSFLCTLQRREILACAPTGSGKTIAFCLPVLAHLRQPLNKGFRALIVAPTRELASQVRQQHTTVGYCLNPLI